MSKRPAKKRRTATSLPFAAPSDADLPSAQQNNPSSSALSTRTFPLTRLPALTTLCARVFVSNLRNLAEYPESAVWRRTRRWLKALPDPLVPKMFAMLKVSCPSILSDPFITAFFLRGSSVSLAGSLPGVNRNTLSSIPKIGESLRELILEDFNKYPDSMFASLVSKSPSLRVLVLRGCSLVGSKTATAAAGCIHLTVVNLNYTAASPISLAPLLIACTELQVLKVAGIPNWTDATLSKLKAQINNFKLSKLRTLKLRQTALSEQSINFLISQCPNLNRLDISFTAIRRFSLATNAPDLEKLSLTSTCMARSDLLTLISLLPHLKILSLGALGGGQGSSAAIGNSSAMTMNCEMLDALTGILKDFQQLESVSLVGNTKLGSTRTGTNRALLNFICRVGRKCKNLNLAGIPHLRSCDLAGLLPEDGNSSTPLENLSLNNTDVDDDAFMYIASCPLLRSLEVAGTKFTKAGLYPILDQCLKLERLDLTSCRGIDVADRRRFFEVWEREKRPSRALDGGGSPIRGTST